jgi:hypothetical protein
VVLPIFGRALSVAPRSACRPVRLPSSIGRGRLPASSAQAGHPLPVMRSSSDLDRPQLMPELDHLDLILKANAAMTEIRHGQLDAIGLGCAAQGGQHRLLGPGVGGGRHGLFRLPAAGLSAGHDLSITREGFALQIVVRRGAGSGRQPSIASAEPDQVSRQR